MSTRGGPPPPEAALRALARRAHGLRRRGRLGAALELAQQAAQRALAGIEAGDTSGLPAWAELVALEGGIAIDAGRFDGVLPRLADAARALQAAPAATGDAARLAAARLQFETGRLHVLQQRLAAARGALAAALAAPDRGTLEGEPGALLRVRARAVLGAGLCMHAEHAEGLRCLEQALGEADGPGLASAGLDRARILINLGAAHFEQHRLEQARQRIEQAQAVLQPLVRARHAGARADLGRALLNLGSIHSHAGRMDESVQAFQASLAMLESAARSVARTGDAKRLSGTRAKASMNLGYALFKTGDFDAAQRHLAGALRRYAPLLQSNPHLRADLARTHVNAAHLAAQRGQAERAAALYERAWRDLESMMAGGTAPHLASDAANARLGIARAALVRGQARRSARLFAAAMATLCELSQAGQLHCAQAWLRAWVEQASLLVEAVPPGTAAGGVLPTLLRVLQAPPLRALGEQEEPLRMPAHAFEALQRWRAIAAGDAARRNTIEALAAAGLHYLLDCSAQVLSGSAPAWLAEREADMQHWVRQLAEAAAAQPDAARLLAQWFLHTRGLRAQRLALAAGTDPRVCALRDSLEALNRLEGELLGATHERASRDAPLTMGVERAAAAATDTRVAEWRTLREQVGGALRRAVSDGLLPRSLQLSALELPPRLALAQAVLFAARLDRTRLLTVALRSDGSPGGCWQHRIVVLPQRLAGVPCDLLNAAARRALQHDYGGAPARDDPASAPRPLTLEALEGPDGATGADGLALAALRELAASAVEPALDALLAAGCRDIAVVPADDLHLLPWGDIVRRRPTDDAAIAVYPNAGAWWRCRVEAVPGHFALPRWSWAAAAGLVPARHLPWVETERRLSEQLWQRSPAPAQDDAACALLAIGHAALQEGNPARAGLRLDDGRVLDAHALAAGGCTHVVLSACVLGRTEDSFGEPLGFLSACFGHRTRFGIGWLTEVPDDAACLFSLAFQFALRGALAREGAALRWSGVFHATCRRIDAGAWPDGFAAWLADAAPAPAGAWPAVPPPALRRVLPWAVALGA
jgi:tetratricopeptide (TPR) repeat protein